jgi:hypothetical protein
MDIALSGLETNKGSAQMTFSKGNKADGKHYWLTPPALMAQLQEEFHFDFDPCPYPKPDDFDGLTAEWGNINYVNPPFGSFVDRSAGKKFGPTAWARKAIAEYRKGKKVVLVYPLDKWIHMLLEEGATVRNLHDVKWLATEDGTLGTGTGRWIAMFTLDPNKQDEIAALTAANAELRRQLDELLKSVEYLRKDVTR